MTDLVPTSTALAARHEDLRAKVARAVTHSRSANTTRAYAADMTDFRTWCSALNVQPVPAAPGTVAAYIAELADPGDDRPPLKVSTIERRLAAIAGAHKEAGQVSPTTDPIVRATMSGIRRLLKRSPTRKTGLSTEQLRAIVSGLGDRPIELRDRALLLLGFAGGLRRSELVALRAEDVEEHPAGLIIHIRSSKTDQEGKGRRVEVVYGESADTCPVRAIRRWMTTAGITSGPLLRSVSRSGKVGASLSDQSVALVVKRHAGTLGLGTVVWAGHSLRRGHATVAAANGADDRDIMRTTGHTTREMLDHYIDDATLFRSPSSGHLGL